MRIAVSGTHGVGKSTLIAAFLARRPEYASEPEAFELLGDDIMLLPSEGPDAQGLAALLEHTLRVLQNETRERVIIERSPVDYFAYARATEGLAPSEREELITLFGAAARDVLRRLDLIVLLPITSFGAESGRAAHDDGERFRERVDEALHQVLLDDADSLFAGIDTPRVLGLPPDPAHQLDELIRHTEPSG
ncbi:MAG: AAA family ATPase [Acidobacteriota bacterium]